MISDKLVDIKNEVDTQEDLINSIALALDGKSVHGESDFIYTQVEQIASSADGTTITIPHKLGMNPAFVDINYIGSYTATGRIIKWQGNENVNFFGTSSTNGGMFVANVNVDANPVGSASAKYCRADANNIYINTGEWGGSILANSRFAVHVE